MRTNEASDRFTSLPDKQTLEATIIAPEEHGFSVEVTDTLDAAKTGVSARLPEGSSMRPNTSMTLQEAGIADAINGGGPPEVATTEFRNPHASRARDGGMDPVVELWVDEPTLPVRIRMAGRLDSSTSPSLLALLDQLLAEGVRHFLMDAGELDFCDAWGATALTVFQRRARVAGGSLIWDGVDLGHSATIWRDETHSTLGLAAPRNVIKTPQS